MRFLLDPGNAFVIEFRHCNRHAIAFQNTGDQDVQKNYCATCFVWMWNLVSCFEGRTKITGV